MSGERMAEPDLVPSTERTGQVPCRDTIVPCSQGGQRKGMIHSEYIVPGASLDCQDNIVRTGLVTCQDRGGRTDMVTCQDKGGRTDLVTFQDRRGKTGGRYRKECNKCWDSDGNTDYKKVSMEEEVTDNQCSLTNDREGLTGVLDMLHSDSQYGAAEDLCHLRGSEEYTVTVDRLRKTFQQDDDKYQFRDQGRYMEHMEQGQWQEEEHMLKPLDRQKSQPLELKNSAVRKYYLTIIVLLYIGNK